jgi:endogenous inhibitor of DNA gyrase (YacG/DUF329 family)
MLYRRAQRPLEILVYSVSQRVLSVLDPETMMLYDRFMLRCNSCGAAFDPKPKTPIGRQRFCSSRCRLVHWRIEQERLASGDRRWVNKR